MKQYLLLPSLLCLSYLTVFSQKKKANNDFYDSLAIMQPIKLKDETKFYINIHSGYAFGLGSTFKFYPDDISSINMQVIETSAPTKTTTYRAPSKGLGQGFRFGLGLSYILNDFVNVGVDVDYSRTKISKVKDSSYYSIQTSGAMGNETTYNEKYTITYDATLITISPHILFKAISRPKFFIYNKVGVVLTFRPNSIQKETQDGKFRTGWQGFYRDSSSFVEKKYEWGIRNPAIGFMGAAGAQVKISERIRAFGEIQFSHLVFVVRERTLTSYTVNGVQMINTLPVMDKELKFERDLSSNDISSNPDQPMRTIIQRIPITYVGAQFGFAYRF